jgi:hypothetical protein
LAFSTCPGDPPLGGSEQAGEVLHVLETHPDRDFLERLVGILAYIDHLEVNTTPLMFAPGAATVRERMRNYL